MRLNFALGYIVAITGQTAEQIFYKPKKKEKKKGGVKQVHSKVGQRSDLWLRTLNVNKVNLNIPAVAIISRVVVAVVVMGFLRFIIFYVILVKASKGPIIWE